MRNLLLAIILTGCSSLPTEYVSDDVTVIIRMHDTLSSLVVEYTLSGGKSIGYGNQLNGFSYNYDGTCYVHYMSGDYNTLAHEIAHCYYGDYHK